MPFKLVHFILRCLKPINKHSARVITFSLSLSLSLSAPLFSLHCILNKTICSFFKSPGFSSSFSHAHTTFRLSILSHSSSLSLSHCLSLSHTHFLCLSLSYIPYNVSSLVKYFINMEYDYILKRYITLSPFLFFV